MSVGGLTEDGDLKFLDEYEDDEDSDYELVTSGSGSESDEEEWPSSSGEESEDVLAEGGDSDTGSDGGSGIESGSGLSEGGGSGTGSDGGSDAAAKLRKKVQRGGDSSAEGAWHDGEDVADTSDEEEVRNTLGNIPLEWYEDYDHLGYDQDGHRILKPVAAHADKLDEFLSKMENADYWRTIVDRTSGKEVVLSEEQMETIQNLQQSRFPDATVDPYQAYVDHFTGEKEVLPLSRVPKPKSSFIPSRWEHRKIVKLAHSIRIGRMKPNSQPPSKPSFYQLWQDGDELEKKRRHQIHIPAPRMQLPGHAESYNPPPEYLPTEQEVQKWLTDREESTSDFLPHRYTSLRAVPGYSAFIRERFERCLDLYLCPRQRKMRVKVDPEELIPQLPPLRDLQPFPTHEALVYAGHTGKVVCVSVHDSGQWLASCSTDKTVKLWEVATTRCMRTLTFDLQPHQMAFSPNTNHSLLLLAVGNKVLLLNTLLGDRVVTKQTDNFLQSLPISSDTDRPGVGVVWECDNEVGVVHEEEVCQVCWHERGDYFATVTSGQASVFVHQLSKARSQRPFKKVKGQVQKVLFHPHKPWFFLATQTSIRVYDLVGQVLVKKLLSGVKWISNMAIHPSGDHILVSSYDKKVCWFDVDLSSKPYKVMRYHNQAVRSVCFHGVLPLFASCSDDGKVMVSHGRVFTDLLQNPLIVPVKQFRASGKIEGLGVLWCVFHPTLPWIFSAGADGRIKLFTN